MERPRPHPTRVAMGSEVVADRGDLVAAEHHPPAHTRLLHVQRTAGNRAAASLAGRVTVQREEYTAELWRDLGPGDWTLGDRLEMQLQGPSADNRFVQAAKHNTLNDRPDAYTSIAQRHAYYDAVQWLLQHDPQFQGTGLEGSRFFGAAAEVTNWQGIGGMEYGEDALGGLSGVSPFAGLLGDRLTANLRRVIHLTNRRLHEMNLRIMRRAMRSGGLVDPQQAQDAPVDAFHFDLRMVETEQREVGQVLEEHPLSDAEAEALNLALNSGLQYGGEVPRHMRWAQEATGVEALDFRDIQHRMAIGRAMVHIAHQRSKEQFLEFIRSGAREYAHTPAREAPRPVAP